MTSALTKEEKQHKAWLLIQEPVAMAKQRLMDFADSLSGGQGYGGAYEPVTYDKLMSRAKAFIEHGEHWNEGSRFDGQDIYSTFWEDYELVTETKVDPDDKYGFFSCSC